MNVGMVFGIITAIIVLVFVIAFGTGQIGDMFCTGSLAQTNKDIMNLQSVIDDLQRSAQGSTDTYTMSVPQNTEICFLNPADPTPNLDQGWRPDPNKYVLIEQQVKMMGYNMWITYACGAEEEPGHRMNYITVNENFCVTSGETVFLRNTGTEVLVQKG